MIMKLKKGSKKNFSYQRCTFTFYLKRHSSSLFLFRNFSFFYSKRIKNNYLQIFVSVYYNFLHSFEHFSMFWLFQYFLKSKQNEDERPVK